MDCSTPGFPVHPTSGAYSSSGPLSPWCHPTISSSVAPLSSCPQSFPASESFPVNQLFTSSGHQSFQWILCWFPLGLTGLISLLSKWPSRVFSSTTVWKYQFFGSQPSLWSNSHIWLTTGKTIALIIRTFVGKMMSVLFNMPSRFVIVFLPGSKHLLISWLQSQSVVILEPKKIVCHYFHFFPIYLPRRDGTGCHNLSFLNVEF